MVHSLSRVFWSIFRGSTVLKLKHGSIQCILYIDIAVTLKFTRIESFQGYVIWEDGGEDSYRILTLHLRRYL